MMRGENTGSLSTDLIMEIFSRLPAKSVARCRCLSKLWGSILRRPYFTDFFLTRSSPRPPRLLIASKQEGDEWCVFTSPQHQNPYEKSFSLIVAADCHMKFRGDKTWSDLSGYTSGLILFRRKYIAEEEYVICNPSTGQFGSLPLPKGRITSGNRPKSFLGFDPIDKQFKLLSISHPSFDENQILTLGTGNDSWRKIHCPLSHYAHHTDDQLLSDCICINGVLYYLAENPYGRPSMIVCFDVRLRLWIMKDVENPESECSEYVCNFKKKDVDGNVFRGWKHHFVSSFFIVGVTATGDIVLSMRYACRYEPFYVGYINPKTNTLRIVEIQGGLGPIGHNYIVQVFIDYVEDVKFINTMTRYTATSIKPSEIEA